MANVSKKEANQKSFISTEKSLINDENDFTNSNLEEFSESSDEEIESSTKITHSHTIKKLNNLNKNNKNHNTKESGSINGLSNIIYISRLPKGFHERELSKYFSQFGDIKQAKLARNKYTGNSRHYGFVEFVNKDDAVIAQETMNNYLIMGHLLKVSVLPKGKKIEKLFKYNRKIYQEAPVKKDSQQLIKKASLKHEERMKKLKESNIDFKW